MAKARRLWVVVAGLALTAWFSSNTSRGDAVKDLRDKLPAVGVKPPPGVQPDRDLDESRFAKSAMITYQTLNGETFFAMNVKPKLQAEAARPRDILVLVSISATQAGPSWFAS